MKIDANDINVKNVVLEPLPELSFVLLPMLVLSVIKAEDGSFMSIFSISDWSFASSVLLGSGILKLINGVSQATSYNVFAVRVLVSINIVFFLVPSLVVLTLIVISQKNNYTSDFLIVSQALLFVASLIVFCLYSFIGSYGIQSQK